LIPLEPGDKLFIDIDNVYIHLIIEIAYYPSPTPSFLN